MVYAIIVICLNRHLWSMRMIRSVPVFRAAFAVITEVIIIMMMMLVGQIVRSHTIFGIAYIASFQLLVSVYIFGQRYPSFFSSFKEETNRARYEYSRLKGVDVEAVRNRLNHLMEVQKIFTEPELTLQEVSEELSLSPHQLSEMLNNYMNISFKAYLNEWRLDEAKRLLLENPQQSILSIAYHSGFNSKSTFNTIFSKETGCTPSKFRRIQNKKGSGV